MNTNQKGLTLIEVIIGLLIFMLVMVLFVNIMMTATGISKRANDIAKESMKEIIIIDQGDDDSDEEGESHPGKITLNFSNGKEVILEGNYKMPRGKANKYLYFDTTTTSQTP